MTDEKIFISLTKAELENLIIDCLKKFISNNSTILQKTGTETSVATALSLMKKNYTSARLNHCITWNIPDINISLLEFSNTYSKNDILKFRNCGSKTILELETILSIYNLELKK